MNAQPKMLSYSSNLPPFSQEAEEAVNAAVMSYPDMYYSVAAYLKAEMFYLVRTGTIWNAIERCMQRDGTVNIISLGDELKGMGELDTIGGASHLMQLAADAPPSIYAEVYARMVERAHVRRQLQRAADDIKALADDESLAISDVIAESQSAFMNATIGGLKRRDANMHEIMFDVGEQLSKAYDAHVRGETLFTGIATGFHELDKLLGGMQKGDLLTLAACTGVGKSALISSMLLNLRNVRVPDEQRPGELRPLRFGGFTMEMGKGQYGQRMLSAYTTINSAKIRQGHLSEHEYKMLVDAQSTLSDHNILIDDSGAPTPEYIVNKCHEWRIAGGLDFVFVDYLQHMSTSPSQQREGRPRQVGFNAESMKNLARDLNIPVLQAAQLNRDVEDRGDKRPLLSDLKDSGQIEQESDVVMFIYRDALYNPVTEHPNLAELIIAKHRNGPTGMVSLYFNKACVRFENGETRRVNLENL